MKTESIRLCIQAQYPFEDYAEARKELFALENKISALQEREEKAKNYIAELKEMLLRVDHVVLYSGAWSNSQLRDKIHALLDRKEAK